MENLSNKNVEIIEKMVHFYGRNDDNILYESS